MAEIRPASAPPQFTTRCARIEPRLVWARYPFASVARPVSTVSLRIRAPCRRAARAKAGVTFSGLALPSVGQKAPPIIRSEM